MFCKYNIQSCSLSIGTYLLSSLGHSLDLDGNTQQKDALSQVEVMALKLSTSDNTPAADRTKCPEQRAHLHVAIQHIFACTIHRVSIPPAPEPNPANLGKDLSKDSLDCADANYSYSGRCNGACTAKEIDPRLATRTGRKYTRYVPS